MRVSFIEMCGFRGFKSRARLDLPSGFAVLTGRNGAGKSTVFDALEYALTGTISKYTTSGGKGRGLNDHIWWVGDGSPKERFVTVGFVEDDGEEFTVTRRPGDDLESPLAGKEDHFCGQHMTKASWPELLVQTSLIRDETIARFSLDLTDQERFSAVRLAIATSGESDYVERAGDLVTVAVSVQDACAESVATAREELGQALTALTEARAAAKQASDASNAAEVLARALPSASEDERANQAAVRSYIADQKQLIAKLSDAVVQAERLVGSAGDSVEQGLIVREQEARAELEDAQKYYDKARTDLKAAEDARESGLDMDDLSRHAAALFEAGERLGLQDGRCPLCDAPHDLQDFADGMGRARSALSDRAETERASLARVEELRQAAKAAALRLERAQESSRSTEAARAKLNSEMSGIVALYAECGLDVSPSDSEGARRAVFDMQDKLATIERALFVLEASSARDRVIDIESRIERIRSQVNQEEVRLARAHRNVETAKSIERASREIPNEILKEQFDSVLPLLKELYTRLRPHAEWRDIDVGFGGRVRASLNLAVGDGHNPQFIFSSGQRRAAGVAFLLAIHLSRTWSKLQTLLLDDPVQHIDDYRALNLVEVLSAVRRMGRQVVVAVEDPALADLLCKRLRGGKAVEGRLFELASAQDGSAQVKRVDELRPHPSSVLRVANG